MQLSNFKDVVEKAAETLSPLKLRITFTIW